MQACGTVPQCGGGGAAACMVVVLRSRLVRRLESQPCGAAGRVQLDAVWSEAFYQVIEGLHGTRTVRFAADPLSVLVKQCQRDPMAHKEGQQSESTP